MDSDGEGRARAGVRGRVLVTGSNRGIGLELVRQYALDGYDVVATCRDPDRATALREIDGSVTIRRLDVTSETDLAQLVADVHGAAIDVLISNAAVFGGVRSRFGDVDSTAWQATLDVNVVGTMRVATSLWQNVAASEQRKMVFLSSRAGLPREAIPNRSYIYASSKAALNTAVRCFALDLAQVGVTAALLNPGHVQSGIGGRTAPMTPAESVRRLRDVIASLTAGDAGKFLHFDGTDLKF
jgi:NAD(P)-dependent dehydrogenase (short-subunit alcohol dehydrogenase family)